jgi:phosphomannomutase / phosphoglucomutase
MQVQVLSRAELFRFCKVEWIIQMTDSVLNAHIFRQYDIRGIADQDLTDSAIDLIGRALATYIKKVAHIEKATIILGRDIRPSSERIEKALTHALTSSGVSVKHVGIVTTPICYFSVPYFGAAGGVMVTGSHNPPEYNGLKLLVGKNTIFGDEIQKIRKFAESKDFIQGSGSELTAEPIPAYEDHIKKSFQFKRRLKVVLDSGNGTAGIVAPHLIRSLGQDVIELFSEPDSRFPNHHPDPTIEKNLQDAIQAVKKNGADVALAFDGDADRLGVVDDRGTIVWGDKLLILFARAILKKQPNSTFVADVKCSNLFFQDVERHGGKAIMWKTGHSLIKQKLKDEKAQLAGEMSGHMFFADRYFGFDDGVYAGIRVLEILDETGEKLSDLLSDLPKTAATPEIRVKCPDDEKFEIVQRTADYFKDKYPTTLIDGVRIDFRDGWGLVRASNTQPVLVTRFEAASEKRLQEIRSLVESKVSQFSNQPPMSGRK